MILISVQQLAFLYTILLRLRAGHKTFAFKKEGFVVLDKVKNVSFFSVYSFPLGKATTKVISSRFFLSKVIIV